MKNRKDIEQIIELIDSYINENNDGDIPVVEYLPPKDLSEKLNLNLPKKKGNIEGLVGEIKKYLKYSVRTSHPQYSNQLWSGYNLTGLLGEMITSVTNTSMITYEVAPVATLMEKELISTMGSLLGFSDADGIFVPGASNANLVAVLSARNQKFPETKEKGISRLGKNPTIFISDQAHYSFLKAANIAGIGMSNVVKVKSDEIGRMVPQELDKEIENSIDEGNEPFFVAATAGTTVTGVFDPIEEIAQIAEKHKVWFHVDGALGSSVCLSEKHKHLLKGSEKADSIGWNAHKMLGLPLVCSVILLKNKGVLLHTASTKDIEEQYLFHKNGSESYDIGPQSFQCGRRVDALKLWLAWTYYGNEGFSNRIDKLFELAQYVEEKVKSRKELELVLPRQSINVCFRYRPSNEDNLDEFNISLRERLRKTGKALVNYATVDGKRVFRYVCLNPEIGFEDIDRFFDTLIDAAKS